MHNEITWNVCKVPLCLHSSCMAQALWRYVVICHVVQPINDIRKIRGDNFIQDSSMAESAIRLLNENTTPDTDSTDDDDVVHFYSAHIHSIECSGR
jgi:hypothetical protein